MKDGRPIQTESQSIGSIGETTVQLILKKFRWTADIIKSDFGEDIDCNIFIDQFRTNYHLRFQVKSSKEDSKYVRRLKNGNFSVSINSDTLRAWLTCYFPVLLVVYEEESESCFWSNPIDEILQNPSKLEASNPSIHVPIDNRFDNSSREEILEEVKKFYRKIQRLDEATIETKFTPLLMPGYKIIPFHQYSSLYNDDFNLTPSISGDYIELLPSWMSVLKRVDPISILSSISLRSPNTELDKFLSEVKNIINSFECSLQPEEWLSFIIHPINLKSSNSTWSNELTYWSSYSKINGEIVNDFEFCFEIPEGFLRQVSRRARSWDSLHQVNPEKDIALQFFGSLEITPTMERVDKIHDNNIKGQLVLWTCEKEEIKEIELLLSDLDLALRFVENEENEILIAITTLMFDPFMVLYSVPMDWESYDQGNVRNTLIKNDLLDKLPGREFDGKVPEFVEKALNQYSNQSYTKVLITEMEYIPGFPLNQDRRQIYLSRFQMVREESVLLVEERLKNVQAPKLKNFHIEFGLIDNSMWEIPIYELLVIWTPELHQSSKESYLSVEGEMLELFNYILPTNDDESIQLRNTYQIVHIAGEIGFENNRND